MTFAGLTSVSEVRNALGAQSYLADEGLATAVFLALSLHRPLLLEGEAGVGKTELAKVISAMTGGELIRLQCYEGIDASQAVYDWDYSRQLLHLRAAEASGEAKTKNADALEGELYNERFLIKRALLRAIDNRDTPAVLLIDEIDRADDEFEAFLLELLSDFQVTIPEIGTIKAERRPVVFLTSNRTRELHEALKRRCLYMWVELPDLDREIAIVRARVPEAPERLAAQAAAFVHELRALDLTKQPGIAETIDWTQALLALGQEEIEAGIVDLTLGSVLKFHEDIGRVRDADLQQIVERARSVADDTRIPAS